MNEKHAAESWSFTHGRPYVESEPNGEVGDVELTAACRKSDDNPDGLVLSSCECCDGIRGKVVDLRLIAAAPELLKSCKELLEYVEDETGCTGEAEAEPFMMEARAVIAKVQETDNG